MKLNFDDDHRVMADMSQMRGILLIICPLQKCVIYQLKPYVA